MYFLLTKGKWYSYQWNTQFHQTLVFIRRGHPSEETIVSQTPEQILDAVYIVLYYSGNTVGWNNIMTY